MKFQAEAAVFQTYNHFDFLFHPIALSDSSSNNVCVGVCIILRACVLLVSVFKRLLMCETVHIIFALRYKLCICVCA